MLRKTEIQQLREKHQPLSNLPDISVNVSNNKVNFENIKEIAVFRLENVMNSKLDFIMSFGKCEYLHLETLSKNIFKWCNKEFIKRRKLKNCIWIDVLEKNAENQSLEKFKIQIDVKEIKSFLKLIFENIMQNINLNILMWEELRDVERYLNIYHILLNDQMVLTKMFRDHELQYRAKLLEKRHTKQQLILWNIEESMLNAQIWDPIHMRFEINWYNSKTEQIRFQNMLLENDVQQEMTKNKFKILMEKTSGDNICYTYYSLAEQYKRYIEILQRRYDYEVEHIDNRINYTRLQISKLIEKEKYLKEKIKQFHEEIKICLEKEKNT